VVQGLIQRVFNTSVYLFLFVSIGILAPQEVKEISPFAWGWVEGKLGWDLTGFWFSSFGGNGKCRITNSQVAWRLPESKIVFGEVSPPGRRPYPHLWVENRGQIVDGVCPPEVPGCSSRRRFATINPTSLTIEAQNPLSEKDQKSIAWGLDYLQGLKSSSVATGG
jgi:hypothetical protein